MPIETAIETLTETFFIAWSAQWRREFYNSLIFIAFNFFLAKVQPGPPLALSVSSS